MSKKKDDSKKDDGVRKDNNRNDDGEQKKFFLAILLISLVFVFLFFILGYPYVYELQGLTGVEEIRSRYLSEYWSNMVGLLGVVVGYYFGRKSS